MSAIRGEEFRCVESFRGCNHGSIDKTQVEIGVFPQENLGSDDVLRLELLDEQLSIRE